MKILVTGARGQLGSGLLSILEGSHHEVLAVGHGTRPPDLDITSRQDVLSLLTTWRPDTVVHAAAMTDVDGCELAPEEAHRINSLGTRLVAEGARRVGAHVVYVSTDYVFDGMKLDPYHEWDSTHPVSVYGASKLGGERELDPGATVVRTSWVCGDVGPNMVKTVLRLGRGEGPLRFVDDQIGHPTFVVDLAPMVLKLAVERAPGVHHVTNSGPVSWFEFAREVLVASGGDASRVEPIFTSDLDPPRAAPRPPNSQLANTVIDAYGWGPLRDFREPLAELVSRLA